MNNINDEILQMKIQGYCLEYPREFEFDAFIDFTKNLCNEVSDYGSLLNNIKNKDYSLFLAIKVTLDLVINYFEQPFQDNLFFEERLRSIISYLQFEVNKHAKKINKKRDPDLIQSFLHRASEFLCLLLLILGDPISKKKFENSI